MYINIKHEYHQNMINIGKTNLLCECVGSSLIASTVVSITHASNMILQNSLDDDASSYHRQTSGIHNRDRYLIINILSTKMNASNMIYVSKSIYTNR